MASTHSAFIVDRQKKVVFFQKIVFASIKIGDKVESSIFLIRLMNFEETVRKPAQSLNFIAFLIFNGYLNSSQCNAH